MFTFSIPVTETNIDIVKRALTKTMPHVKSSHRAEAMARGLGFGTNASLREALRQSDLDEAQVDAAAFKEYLTDRAFETAGTELHGAAAKAALSGVANAWPRLTGYGFGIGEHQRRNDGRLETTAQYVARFEAARAELHSDHAVAPFLASVAFLSRVERTRTIRPKTNSYWLKHIAENYACTYPGGEPLGRVYVTNGLLIAAAAHMGFQIKPSRGPYGEEGLNATFNMGHASLVDLDCEIRPEGSRAQERRRAEERRARRKAYGRSAGVIFFD